MITLYRCDTDTGLPSFRRAVKALRLAGWQPYVIRRGKIVKYGAR